MPSPNEILAELRKVKYPGFTRDIVSFGIVKDIEVAYAGVTVMIAAPSQPTRRWSIKSWREYRDAIGAMPGVPAVRSKSAGCRIHGATRPAGWRRPGRSPA